MAPGTEGQNCEIPRTGEYVTISKILMVQQSEKSLHTILYNFEDVTCMMHIIDT